MNIQEIENPNNDKLKIKPVKFSSDEIDDSLPKPLPNYGFFMFICGKPRSGKTTFLLSLICNRGKMYNKKFDIVYVFSASLFNGNLSKNPLDKLPDEQKFTDLKELEEVIEGIKGTDKRVLFIFDDIQHELKGDKLTSFLHLVNNRRHYTSASCSIILTSQQYIGSVDLKIRKSLSNIVFFPTKNSKEIKALHTEYLTFLNDEELKQVLAYVWEKTHDFLFLDCYAAQDEMIYKNFNRLKLVNGV